MTKTKVLEPLLLFSKPLLKKQSFYWLSQKQNKRKIFSPDSLSVLACKTNNGKSWFSSKNILQTINEVEETINKKQLIGASTDVVCTVSGGQDSIFLLFCLSFLQLQMDFSIKLIWCNHFWQACSFYTTLHLAKCAVSFSSPIVGFLPFQRNTSTLFYRIVRATYKNKSTKTSLLAFRLTIGEGYASNKYLFANGDLLHKISNNTWKTAKPKIIADTSNFLQETSLCSQQKKQKSLQNKLCLLTRKIVSPTPLSRYGLNTETRLRRVWLLLLYRVGARFKGYKKFMQEISEGGARNWRHITTERGCTFYGAQQMIYGHTGSDRVETILFNLIRGFSTLSNHNCNCNSALVQARFASACRCKALLRFRFLPVDLRPSPFDRRATGLYKAKLCNQSDKARGREGERARGRQGYRGQAKQVQSFALQTKRSFVSRRRSNANLGGKAVQREALQSPFGQRFARSFVSQRRSSANLGGKATCPFGQRFASPSPGGRQASKSSCKATHANLRFARTCKSFVSQRRQDLRSRFAKKSVTQNRLKIEKNCYTPSSFPYNSTGYISTVYSCGWPHSNSGMRDTSKKTTCLPWKRRYSDFCYNSFYPSYKQVIKRTHLRQSHLFTVMVDV